MSEPHDLSTPSDRSASERGSVAMATLLIVFATMIGMVVVGQSIARLRDSTTDADRASATAGTELGVAEALAHIEQGATSDFAGSVSTPSVAVTYEAIATGDGTWQIYSEGAAGDATQARRVTIGGSFAPFGLFAGRTIDLLPDNNGSITGGIGSSGSVSLGGTSVSEPVVLYQPGGTCADCPSVVTGDTTPEFLDPVVPAEVTQPCPPGNEFGSWIDGRGGEPFLCFDQLWDVDFRDTVEIINPPAIIHVGADVEIEMEDARINLGGSTTDFQLLVHRTNELDPAQLDLEQSEVNGLIYAPGRRAETDGFVGNGAFIFGELVQQMLEVDGPDDTEVLVPSTVDITRDPALDSTVAALVRGLGGWSIASWDKVGPRP